jgi:predicted TPR repeat methyltransferase
MTMIPAATLFDKYADLYAEKYMDVGLYADGLDFFCAELPATANVLELACGPGNLTKYILDKRPDTRLLATDLAPNMLELAQKYNPTAEIMVLDCRDFVGLHRTFNGIVCGFALPYLDREAAIQLIVDAGTCLEPGGLLYLSTMEDDYSKSGIETSSRGDKLYMYYHEAGYLTATLTAQQFEIVHLQRKTYTGAKGTEVTDLVVIARKK